MSEIRYRPEQETSLPSYLHVDEEHKAALESLHMDLESGIEDPEEAREAIIKIREYEDPILTVPKEYFQKINAQGYIEAVPDWTNNKLITATLGRQPYNPDGENTRVHLRIKSHIPVEPRFVGKGSKGHSAQTFFTGIVSVKNRSRLFLDKDVDILN